MGSSVVLLSVTLRVSSSGKSDTQWVQMGVYLSVGAGSRAEGGREVRGREGKEGEGGR